MPSLHVWPCAGGQGARHLHDEKNYLQALAPYIWLGSRPLLLTHVLLLPQADEASRGSMASSEKAGRGAGSIAGSAATGESGRASQLGERRRGRGRTRTLARRGSLLGLAQASAKGDEGQDLGSWKVFTATWLETELALGISWETL